MDLIARKSLEIQPTTLLLKFKEKERHQILMLSLLVSGGLLLSAHNLNAMEIHVYSFSKKKKIERNIQINSMQAGCFFMLLLSSADFSLKITFERKIVKKLKLS